MNGNPGTIAKVSDPFGASTSSTSVRMTRFCWNVMASSPGLLVTSALLHRLPSTRLRRLKSIRSQLAQSTCQSSGWIFAAWMRFGLSFSESHPASCTGGTNSPSLMPSNKSCAPLAETKPVNSGTVQDSGLGISKPGAGD